MANLLKQNRIAWIDTAKAISIFIVVAGHCAEKTKGDVFLLHLSMFAGVGTFFLLSGMTFCFRTSSHSSFSLESHDDLSQGDGALFPWFDRRPWTLFFKNLIKRTIFPYLFWSCISIFIYAVAGEFAASYLDPSKQNFDLIPNLLGMLYANTRTGLMEWNRPIWFLPCLVCVEFIWYGVLWICSSISSVKGRYIFYGLAMLIPLCWLIGGNVDSIRLCLPWELETAICVLPLFGAGRILRNVWEKYLKKEQSGKRVFILLTAGISWFLLIVLLFGTKEADFRADTFSRPFLILPELIFGSAAVLCTAFLAGYLGKLQEALTYVGKRTLSILVLHKFAVSAEKILLIISGWDDILRRSFGGAICLDFLMAFCTVLLCLAAEKVIGSIVPCVFGKDKKYTDLSGSEYSDKGRKSS